MPRKVAELLRSDETLHESLTRLSALARVEGTNARMVERIASSSQLSVSLALAILREGLCNETGRSFPDFATALGNDDVRAVWRAAMLAETIVFVTSALETTGLDVRQTYATAWAIAETVHWVATKHVVDPDEAFVCGLLLDIGLVALAHSLPEVYVAVSTKRSAQPVEKFEAEGLGFDHAAVGGAVLRVYRFPDFAVDQALIHHRRPCDLDMFGKVLRAATAGVANEGGDNGLGSVPPPLDLEVLEGALLKAEDEIELRSRSKSSLERALRFSPGAGFRAA
jgi:hypothetical protein